MQVNCSDRVHVYLNENRNTKYTWQNQCIIDTVTVFAHNIITGGLSAGLTNEEEDDSGIFALHLCPRAAWTEAGSTNQGACWRAAVHGRSKCPDVRRRDGTAGWLITSAESEQAQMHGTHLERTPCCASLPLWTPPTASWM